MTAVSFSLNDRPVAVEADPDTPLLDVLRGELNLLGTRFGCGLGSCGACTVHLDGRPVHACDLPVDLVAGRRVRTVEGLAGPDGALHPLQRACLEAHAFQCGYCSSGILMTAVALLDGGRPVPDAAVREALDGNLCRCGAHPGVLRAIRAYQAGEHDRGGM